jgi:hypothetical protein
MEILARSDDWTPNDSDNLAKFLETDTGKRLIPNLVQHCPALLDKGETNAILIRNGEVRAWNGMIESLFVLAHPPAPTAAPNATEYPALEDDKAWNDGQKLEASKTESAQ